MGSAVLPGTDFGRFPQQKGIVGLQLYSIRAEMGEDPLGSLKQVAEMGYEYIEHASYRDRKFYGYEPKEFRKKLNDKKLFDIMMTSLDPDQVVIHLDIGNMYKIYRFLHTYQSSMSEW